MALNTALPSIFIVMSNFKRAYGVRRVRCSPQVHRQQDTEPSRTKQLSVGDMNSLLCRIVGTKPTFPVVSSLSKCALPVISLCMGQTCSGIRKIFSSHLSNWKENFSFFLGDKEQDLGVAS